MSLRRPRPLPPRYRRPVSPSLRRLVEQRHQRQRADVRQRRLRHLRRFFGRIRTLQWLVLPLGYAAIVLTVASILFLLLFSPWTNVQEIRVIRNDPRVDIARIQHALSPLFGRRMLLLSRADVLPLLETSLSDLQDVMVDVSYPSRLVIRVTLDALAARMQIDEGKLAAQSGAFLNNFLTEEGIYLQYPPSYVRHADELPLFRITDWGVHPTPGNHILTQAFLANMQKTEEILQRDFGQETTERLIFLRAREFHLRTAKWWLWFDARDPIEEQLRRYRLFLQSVQQEQVIEYVDLRPVDRVVYR
ncbi:hypothetical protein A3H22_03220 [Candidatus Peribacteria bacterium RIFCSPLOWO2_12_FULL_55_15]|nr:MAG: hypothetical protein A2789_03425 [Candidatus Peribacteria bacterium RIFCSPHIGHO2_01_FULL_54_22]OGJ63057.1 MAG: hypothetical protein A3D12_00745 [Candidatus Peribacteria bacterium RIFCSPHIGHO2_02_FULL_55_24]OGJ69223.1 MAG: hypothetical protein A3H90_02385 [Candidatus Peribacteria bacterium RIFCSPLOWO2_02_FULL_55_36]OGJ71426.1 MAG: hypothetical protein A3H22_03220 [Candidatus Peribacteria bacterium RIFCSPLOWO2_12_FULL_55_15]